MFQPNLKQKDKAKPSNFKKWRKVTEFTIVSLAVWLNPQAGLLIFLLKLCFLILWTLQDKDDPQK
ncbi:MAG TPA: hypothetical protein V6D18_06785 [Thermosynechococcaceae cyanobacterium]